MHTSTDLASLITEDEFDGIVVSCYRGDLSGYPGVVLVLEPNPSSLTIDVFCHGGSRQKDERNDDR